MCAWSAFKWHLSYTLCGSACLVVIECTYCRSRNRAEVGRRATATGLRAPMGDAGGFDVSGQPAPHGDGTTRTILDVDFSPLG